MGLPNFNLSVGVYHSGTVYPGPPDFLTPGNLQFGRKNGFQDPGYDSFVSSLMWLLLPAGTDVRSLIQQGVGAYDHVEVPAGSGRLYTVRLVDDVSKGFPTEYRVAVITQVEDPNAWPVPMP